MESKRRAVKWSFFLSFLVLVSLFLVSHGMAATAREPYTVGLSAVRTGPAAISYMPSSEGFRIYIQKINDEGGINGRPVKLMLEDDGGSGAKAATNIKKFAEAGASLVMVSSTSATYAAAIAEAKRANIPIIFSGGSVSAPQAAPPNPDPLVFVASDKGAATDPHKAMQPISQLADGPVTLGMVVTDIPVAVMIAKKNRELAEAKGWKVVESRFPMGTFDLTPVAEEWIKKGVNWGVEHGPGGARLMYPALMKRGWKGNFLIIGEAFNYLSKMKADNLYAACAVAPLELNLPEHKEVTAAAKKYKASILLTESLWGWDAAKVLEKIFKQVGWPVTTKNLLNVMNNFEIDNRPLSRVTKWTANDHVGFFIWRVYKWDNTKNKVIAVTDWWRADAIGKIVEKVGPNL